MHAGTLRTVYGMDYATRDEEEPWALNLVVRVERDTTVAHEDLLDAAASAVVKLLLDDRAQVEWCDSITRWHDGRIRKLCRRARGVKWEATASLDHVEVTIGSATVRAFVPTPVASQPVVLAKLQLSGTDFEGKADGAIEKGDLVVWLSPRVEMTSAKAAVQGAHGAQLIAERLVAASHAGQDEELSQWRGNGCAIKVREATEAEWATLLEVDEDYLQYCFIRDAGFTEVAAGSLTAIGVAPSLAGGIK